MESLREVPILNFNPDTLVAVRKEYNLDDTKILNEAIDLLEDWVKKQTHFLRTDYTREYLERTIITTKGSVERAKSRLDKANTLKSLLPDYFSVYDVRKLRDITQYVNYGPSKNLTADNYRPLLFRFQSTDFDSATALDFYRSCFIFGEYIKKSDYFNGSILILDFSDVNTIHLLSKINPMDLKNLLTVLMDGYGMRIKALHFLSGSKMIDALISIFKQILSAKLVSRIHVHKGVDTLYDHIPRQILPEDYGGEDRPLAEIYSDWMSVAGSEEFVEYTKELFEHGIDEEHRQTRQFSELYTGMPGSFRRLTVD